jgi:hypothetical protein
LLRGIKVILRDNFRRGIQDANLKIMFERLFEKAIVKGNFERVILKGHFGGGIGRAGLGESVGAVDRAPL